MKCNLPRWNLRKGYGNCSERRLHVVRDGEFIVEDTVDQLDGEVGSIRGGGRPRNGYCLSGCSPRNGVDGKSRNKGKSERERARQH